MERKNLNPQAGLRASHEWMGDVSTIPEAGRQNPGSDITPSSSASPDFTQSNQVKGVMSLEAALVRVLQRVGSDMIVKRSGQNSLGGTTGCDVYEVRPRKSRDGVDLVSDRFRYGPIWYAGPDAVRKAVAYAKYRSLSRSHWADIRVLDDCGTVIQKH